MTDHRMTMRRELMIPKAGDASIAVEFPADEAFVTYRVVLDPDGGIVLTPDGLGIGTPGLVHGDLPGGLLHAVAIPDFSGDPIHHGFMSCVDKAELDARTPLAAGLRLVERGEFAEVAFGWVDAVGASPGTGTRMIANALPSAAGALAGRYDFRFTADGLQFADATGLRSGARRFVPRAIGDTSTALQPDTVVVVVNPSGSNRVLTLPGAAANTGTTIAVTNAASSMAPVSVTHGSGDDLDGAAEPYQLAPGDSAWFISAGDTGGVAGWWIHGRQGLTVSELRANPPDALQLAEGIDVNTNGPKSRVVYAIGTDNGGPLSVVVNIPTANGVAGAEIVIWAVDQDISITLNFDPASAYYPEYVLVGAPVGGPMVLTLRATAASGAQAYWVPVATTGFVGLQQTFNDPSGDAIRPGYTVLCQTSTVASYALTMPTGQVGRRLSVFTAGPGSVNLSPQGDDGMQSIVGSIVSSDNVLGYGEYVCWSDGGINVWRRIV